MPQRRCCVPSCTSSLIEGAILHAFPNPSNEREKFLTWVTNAGLVGEDDNYVFKNRKICHLHFEEVYHYPKNRLSSLAIPTLLLSGAMQDATIDRPVPMVVDEPFAPENLPRFAGISQETVCDRPVPMVLDNPQPSTTRKTNTGTRGILQRKIDIDLHKEIAKMKVELARCKRIKDGLIQKLKIARKFTYSKAYNIVTKHLSPTAKTFFDMQLRQSAKHPKGHRFTLNEKILALSLYKPSPKAYRLLSQICVLPKKSTLNKLMSKIFLLPGPNDVIFEHLKKMVDKMPNSHKYCTLLFDEMAIAANLSYDKYTDKIKGFCDDGFERTKSFADHALVFMIRGIFKKYKQPVAFSFCSGTTNTGSLKKQLKIILQKVLQTGLKVVSTTCDQGSTNMAAINSLINDTKATYIREERVFKGGFFEIENNAIYPIYDPPHLMKGIRNNLLTKDLEFYLEGKKRTAKWDHLLALYTKGPGYKGMRLLPKLTARHVMPHLIPKMKVKYCTQVFSRTVSVAMGFTAGTGRIPRSSTDTADLLLFFDNLFDSVNGSYSKIQKGKIYRSAVSPKSPHHRLWYKSLPVLKSMKFIGSRRGVVPSISSWIKTIQAFQEITKKLHSLGLRSLLLRNFNQDPLENFFGAIRAHGLRNIMPTSSSFEASYKSLIINNMASPKSVGANCESDDTYCLQTLEYFLNQNIAPPVPKEIEINIEHQSIQLSNLDNLLKSEIPGDIEKCAAAAYCSGWLIHLINKTISKNCDSCKKDLEGDSEESFSKYITLKKYTNKCILHYPNKRLLEFLLHIEEITIEILKTNCELLQISDYIELISTTLITLDFITCENHKEKLKKFIFKKSILLILHNWCKDVSNLLCGKQTVWDENDPMKQLAHNYYVKMKTKNKSK